MRENDRYWSMRLPSELHDQLVARAKAEARTPAAAVRMLAQSYVESEPGEPLHLPGSRRPPP